MKYIYDTLHIEKIATHIVERCQGICSSANTITYIFTLEKCMRYCNFVLERFLGLFPFPTCFITLWPIFRMTIWK